MKVISLIRIVTGFAALAALAGSSVYGQAEIDPDHFDSAAPTHAEGQRAAVHYRGKFSLPYMVQCNGVSLPPGDYQVSIRSDGKVGRATLNQGAQAIGITGIVSNPQSKGMTDVLLVEHDGDTRRLSVIQAAGIALVFDPQLQTERAPNSKSRRMVQLPLMAQRKQHLPTRTAQNRQ